MIFSSVFFLFVFLPLFIGGYYLTPMRHRSWIILAGSYVFYGWWRVDFLLLLMLTTAWNFQFGKMIYAAHEEGDRRRAKRLLAVAIVGDLCVLGYFKYWNFFVDSLAITFNGGEAFSPLFGQVILPIGISFYTFQAISYVVDVHRRDAEPARNLVDFAAFIALFPQLIAGPVLRYKDLADQFVEREHSMEKFGEGARRFFLGLAKKVLIADSVAPVADAMFALENPTMAEAWLGAIAYTIQLYFDFSGYSGMAIGLGLMLGFRFIENFRYPYISRSITEFWRRWHQSLSAWLRDYLYIPLGGNRLGVRRTYVNLFMTMVLGGLWHGANWTFVLWGAWHGALLAMERAQGVDPKAPRPLYAWPMTMLAVMVGWVMFRAENVSAGFDMLSGMAGLNGFAVRDLYAWQISRFALFMTLVGIVICWLEPRADGTPRSVQLPEKPRLGQASKPLFGVLQLVSVSTRTVWRSAAAAATASILGLAAVVKLVADKDSPFLYFQF
ncbi:MAG: MBOAT family protein [Pseudomonadota bacterium]